MKIALLLALFVVGRVSADTDECTDSAFICAMKSIGRGIKNTAITVINLGSNLKDAGKAILAEAFDKGTDLLKQGAKAIIGTVGNHLATLGKRETELSPAVSGILSQGKAFLQNAGEELKRNLEVGISRLIEICNTATGLDFSHDVSKEVDAAVADFKNAVENTMLLVSKGVEGFLGRILKHQLSSSKRGISGTSAPAVATLQGALKAIGEAIAPHVLTVIGRFADLGKQIKDLTAALVDKVKQSITELSGMSTSHVGSLVSHGQTLVQHGNDALGAAKEAAAQIAGQTINNVKAASSSDAAVGKDAASVIADHVANGY